MQLAAHAHVIGALALTKTGSAAPATAGVSQAVDIGTGKRYSLDLGSRDDAQFAFATVPVSMLGCSGHSAFGAAHGAGTRTGRTPLRPLNVSSNV